MPVYEYKCSLCGRKIEKLSRGMVHTVQCECGGMANLVVSMPGRFQRGSGWNSRMDGASMPGEA